MQTRVGLLIVVMAIAVIATDRATAAPRMTSFEPAVHGYQFENEFQNDFIRELDVRTGGLCGGMVYTALDFYHSARRSIPTQSYRPAVQTRLHDYIYDRQVHSIADNVDKWTELGLNLEGSRSSQFFRWGLQGFDGGRLEELRAAIDRGRPVPLGLQRYESGPPGNHQVLAIGYDLGRYRGDLGRHKADLKIFVYDPNQKGTRRTLVPDLEKELYFYLEDPSKRWLTYFVDRKYTPHEPPAISADRPTTVTARRPGGVVTPATPSANAVRDLLLEITTGDDDLRGGNDNVHVIVHYRGKPPQRIENINRGRRWLDRYAQTVRIPLRHRVPVEDILAVELLTRFSGGFGGDNWNVNRLRVIARGEGFDDRQIYDASGTPLVRFDGERKTYRAVMR